MQFLGEFFRQSEQGTVITADQGSAFAKQIAGDFNPIHDPSSKRFCVPGDLLFAVALAKYGLHQSMRFEFLDMVKADSLLAYPRSVTQGKAMVSYAEASNKDVLALEVGGESTNDGAKVESLLRKYVAFSGQNFPSILMPLMEQYDVMINPARPLVIYQSMSFEISSLTFSQLDIELESTSLEVNGKRGDASLNFAFYDGQTKVGHGVKNLVLSGLRPYNKEVMQELCDNYLANAKTGGGN